MKLFFTSFLAFSFIVSHAQLIAFPGAEGFGRVASGGRGTSAVAPKIFEVTTLADGNVAGTFRYACTNNSPAAPNRIIVFRVGGTIHLTSAISMNRANTTIAGQTAPGGGICIADYPVTINANNIIVRYIRFRLGDRYQAATLGMDDAFGDNGGGKQKVIIDHCTMSWSTDEALTVYKGDSVTLQWNIISEPLDYNYHTESSVVQRHAYGGIESGAHISIHHNLYAHIRGRMPRFDGLRNAAVDTADYRNNVLYNWADYTVNGGEGGAYNLVNNYYKSGPSSPTGTSSGVTKKAMIVNPYKALPIPYGKFFLTGNYVAGYQSVTDRNWLGAAMNSGTYTDTVDAKSDNPINISIPINNQTALDAYASVLANAGATLPVRDTLDVRIANDVRNGTGRLIDVQGGYPGYPTYTPYATTQTAWPTLAVGTPQTDTDHDGMPDVWETQRGLNAASSADLNTYTATTGYNNIETYLNGDTLTAPGILNTCVVTKSFASTNSSSWLYARDTTYSHYNSANYLAATDSNNIAAAVLDNGSFGTFNVSYYTTDVIRTYGGKPYLNRNITIEPANPLLITGPVTVRLFISKKEFDDLKTADATISTINDLNILKLTGSNCTGALAAGYTVIAPTATGVYGSYANGYFLEFQTSSFSTFYIASKINFLLPLKQLSFDAQLQHKKVTAVWETENEINTSSFIIEKSSDALRFSHAGTVVAFNTPGKHSYSFIDAYPLPGISFYRLKITDNDNRYSFSDIRRIINNEKGELKIFPDPVKNILTVTHASAEKHSYIKIINSAGKIVLKRPVTEGTVSSVFDVSFLHAGVYTLVFENANLIRSQLFISIN